MSEEGNNPFAALLRENEPSISSAKVNQSLSDTESKDDSGDEEILNLIHESNLIHKVFLITINDASVAPSEGIPTHCVFLFDMAEQIKDIFGQDWTIIEFTSAQQAVFERLLCPIPSDLVINTSTTNYDNEAEKTEAGEELALKYLFECYKRLLKESRLKKELFNKCESIIISIAATCLLTPVVINNQNVHQQMFDIIMREFRKDNFDASAQFFKLVAAQVNSDEMSCTDAFGPVLKILYDEMKKQPGLVNSVNYGYCAVIWVFSDSAYLAEVLLKHMTPADPTSGKAYEESSVGKILCLTCLPNKNDNESFKFFDEPSRNTHIELSSTQNQIWQLTSLLNTKVQEIFLNICKSSVENKHKMLEWLGNCMRANIGRGKMWSVQNQSASDGFFVNLGAVMLHMCHRFATPNSPRMLSVDFRYCKVEVKTSDDMKTKGVHLRDLPKADFLRQLDEGESVPERSDPFNFSTDCFFLTHRCLQLGINVVHSRFMKVNRELHQYQQAFQEHQQLGNVLARTGLLDELKDKMEKATSLFLSMKAALSESRLTSLCMQFHTATAQLLVQCALTNDFSKTFVPSLPTCEETPSILSCVPAYIVENIVDFLLFVRRFQDQKFEEFGEHLDHLLSFIIVFMGNKQRINNYHLRAKLADILDSLRPNFDTRTRSNIVSTYHRQRIFNEHPLRMLLSRSLLTIFNDIEFSGDEHAFEQKFNYRIPMYRILHYLWSLDEHRMWIKDLSEEAMLTIEDPIPPLFVQFINLLINDAIFTLDEAMDYLKKIRELEMQKESPEWESMTANERILHESNLRTQGNIARFFNIMANESIKVLSYISSEIKDVFTHCSMVDRVAAMFNDFLLKLVGRKMGLLKVRDFDAYDFKPKQLVKDISQIYVNLGDRDEFCEAVAGDERSYTPGLFIQVERVLMKIFAASSMIEDIKVVAAKFKSMSMLKETEEELFADAPDEFLDPLLSILMTDPVLLPTSNQTVERSTIQRHIMSDPHDPFNRKDLTMDMVVPNDELRERIQKWKEEKRKNAR